MAAEFFDELQRHSEAKLKILNDYVIPWMRKIVLGTAAFGGKCLVIDGFAGKGKYESGSGGAPSDGSPLILLKNAIRFCEQAKQHRWATPNINLIFIEGLEENFRALQANIKEILGIEIQSDINGKFFFKSNEYPTINVACVNEEFQHVLATILNRVPGLIPSFCFIDPFGFSQTPFTLIQRYMRNARAEIFLNFIYEETNRFLSWKNEKVQDHMKQYFGVESMEELHELIGEHKGEDRKKIVVDYYSRKLTTAARINHVLNFEIIKGGRTKLILFYGTKSPHGLRLMKNVMWKVDDTGCFLYDDRKGNDQVVFQFVQDMLEEQLTTELAEKIHQKFDGTRNIKIEQIEEFILFETIYPIENYARNALKLLEEEQKRITSVVKIDGSKRKKGTYKDVHINF